MNEIKLIHLGRQPFTIAVDAHGELRRYIEAITKRTSKDVVEEIEIRMAELLIERGFDDKKVVLSEDVDYLKENLGQPTDFSDDEKESEAQDNTEPETGDRKLFRDSQNGVAGGVAAGVAAYTGIPVWVVRLAFIVFAFTWGASILLYLALWLMLPDAKTPSDRLQMSGKPITVDTIKEFVDSPSFRENAKELGTKAEQAAAKLGAGASKGVNGVAHVTTKIGRTILSIFGIIFVVAGLAAAIIVVAVGGYALFSPGSLLDSSMKFPVGSQETLLVVLGVVIALIVFLMLISAGMAMVRRRWPLPGWLSAALLAIMIAGSVFTVPIVFSAGPQIKDRYNAALTTTTIKVAPFTSVEVQARDDEDVVYIPSDKNYIEIQTMGASDISSVKPVVENGVLKFDTHGIQKNHNCSGLCIHIDDVRITIYGPKDVDLRGVSSFGPFGQEPGELPEPAEIPEPKQLKE
jgi:phage shock protein PspC (stress-responsive transcriptional regulator)